MKMIFTGDVFLGGDLTNKEIVSNINSEMFQNAHIRIINLEQSISDNSSIVDKCTLYTGSFAIKQLQQMGVTAVNLAHNHIQDKTDAGIIDTLQNLDNAGIGHFGAGQNISTAKEPYWIDDMTCILGYCEFARPYLKEIQLALVDTPGVNPLRYDEIIEDLNKLPCGKKTILYFHWGREHVWIPPFHDIQLAKKLLDDDRVLLIIGMHCHRIQGYIDHNGKRAYMSLGNFLFPNFFIKPPTQITNPDKIPNSYPITRQYHCVQRLTYKKWRLINRISLIVEFDPQKGELRHIPVIQDDNKPVVKEIHGFKKIIVLSGVSILNLIYKFPEWIYTPLERVNTFLFYKLWNAQIILFRIHEKGIILTGKVIFLKIIKK